MRPLYLLIPALLAATPAAAQQSAAPHPAPVLPPEITDGRMVDQLGDVVSSLSKALLNLPVGEVQATIENRPVTSADRAKTVRSESGISEGDLDRQIADSKGAVQAGSQAMVRALPVVTEALNRVGDEIARAVANLPSPAYPRR